MTPEEFNELLNRYLRMEMSQADVEAFFKEVSKPENQLVIDAQLEKGIRDKLFSGHHSPGQVQAIYREFIEARKVEEPADKKILSHQFSRFTQFAAATSGLLIITAGIIFFSHRYKTTEVDKQIESIARSTRPFPVPVAGQKALLTLSNGNTVNPDSLPGAFTDANANLSKPQKSSLSYQVADNLQSSTTAFNTLTTGKQSVYQLQLSDGTRVWLNAHSTLSYPVSFNGQGRKVVLSGEAYFEVVADASHPFFVYLNGVKISVLGTRFNISGYRGDSIIKTSLISGKVAVSDSTHHVVLKPLEMVSAGATWQSFQHIDTAALLSWKKGVFEFEGRPLAVVLEEIGRWYGLKIIYEGTVPRRWFYGQIDRNSTPAQVVSILQINHIHCTLRENSMVIFE